MSENVRSQAADKNGYDKETDGSCAIPGIGVESAASRHHTVILQTLDCAFCAYKNKKTLFHKEKDCVNEISLTGSTKTQNQSSGKDFQ